MGLRTHTQWKRNWVTAVIICLGLFERLALAKAEDPDAAQERARNAYIERFTTFTQDKNVQSKPQTPDGKMAKGGRKTRFNQDDGGLFQSDLTYHDYSYNTLETQKGANGKTDKVSRLFAFVSDHGGVDAAGGSSVLERTVYGLHKQFTKQDTEENNKKNDNEKGIKYRSIFKITTQEVFNEDAKNAKGAAKAEPDRVERFELREEVKPQVEKVGSDSAETILRAAKDPEKADDPNALSNGVFLRFAAGAATQALWNSTLSNLMQRRINRGIRAGDFPDTPQLSEGVARCEDWGGVAKTMLANERNEEERKRMADEINRMVTQCNQLANTNYNQVNPRFTAKEDGKGEELAVQGPQKEDAFSRDLRNQLEVMAKAGVDVQSLPSNWKYSDADNRARVTIGFDDTQKKGTEQDLTVREQLDLYNNQLKEAAKATEEVRSRLPDLKMDTNKILSFQIQPETKSIMEINQPPKSAFEEVQLEGPPAPTPAKNYKQLLQQSQQ